MRPIRVDGWMYPVRIAHEREVTVTGEPVLPGCLVVLDEVGRPIGYGRTRAELVLPLKTHLQQRGDK